MGLFGGGAAKGANSSAKVKAYGHLAFKNLIHTEQARAKLDLREEVTEKDALDVVDLIKVSIVLDHFGLVFMPFVILSALTRSSIRFLPAYSSFLLLKHTDNI